MKSNEFFNTLLDYDLQLDNTLYLIIGSDSGLILPYIKQLSVGRGSKFAVIEHDDVYPLIAKEYRGLLETHNNPDSDEKIVTLHAHSSWQHEIFDGTDKPWLLGGQVRLVESNASSADYSRLYMPILCAVKKAASERVLDISVTLSRRVFTEMQFRNATDSTVALDNSLDFGAGRSALILGGGPSLDLHLDWVISNRDRLFIFAVSRIAGKLMKHDIKPDILVSVDPYDISYEVSKKGILWTDVPLVYNFHVSSKLLQQWQGPAYLLGKRLPWHSVKQQAGKVMSAGPTVSHTAVFVASQLGFSQILMTGVDLCYSVSASTHADDSPEQMIQQMPSLCDAKVETYNGRIAGTSAGLKQSVDALNDLGVLINRNKPVLFNLSDEAARCESISHISIADVQLPSEKPDFSTHMDTEIRAVSPEELEELERDLKLARHSFTQVRMLCTKAKSAVSKMHAPDVGLHAKKYSIKLSRIRKELESDYEEYLAAITYDKAVEFSKTQLPTDFKDMKKSELIDWGRNYYDLIEKGTRSMIEEIEKLQKRIQLRRDEHDPSINVRELAKRWREDETPGRILLWKRLNWHRVAPEDRAWVQRSVGKFRSTLNEPSRSTREYLLGENMSIENVMKSLVFLSDSKRQDELQAIASRLDANTWPYSALKPFTEGLLMDLENNTQGALNRFQTSIDTCSEHLENNTDSLSTMQRLIEECLVRMTQCYMSRQDHESALVSLGMLCEMLPLYVVSYAKMLNLCGQRQFAIELLESYVELYPSNKKAHFILNSLQPDVKPQASEVDPVYVDKISDAMHAIMGNDSKQTV
ncbi:MAG: 6-hydroxymethylpterin diphosphokinase MptE-like protein [Granulosicoccus sp.]